MTELEERIPRDPLLGEREAMVGRGDVTEDVYESAILGDGAAIESLRRVWVPQVMQWLFRSWGKTLGRSEIEAISEDAFSTTVTRLGRLKCRDSAWAYLRRVAENDAYHRLKHTGRLSSLGEKDVPAPAAEPTGRLNLDVRETLQSFAATLDPVDLLTLVLRCKVDASWLTVEIVARAAGESVRTIKRRSARITRRLSRCLER